MYRLCTSCNSTFLGAFSQSAEAAGRDRGKDDRGRPWLPGWKQPTFRRRDSRDHPLSRGELTAPPASQAGKIPSSPGSEMCPRRLAPPRRDAVLDVGCAVSAKTREHCGNPAIWQDRISFHTVKSQRDHGQNKRVSVSARKS